MNWVVLGVVVAVVVLAGLDELRSSDDGLTGSAPRATEGVTTRQRESGADLESSRELRDLEVVRLIPGRVAAVERNGFTVTFTVPPGWYGFQSDDGFVIGKRLNDEVIPVDFAAGGVAVLYPYVPYSYGRRFLEDARGIRVRGVSRVRVGGYSGRTYSLVVSKSASLTDSLFGALQPGESTVTLLGVRGMTLFIRQEFDEGQERHEIDRVVMSFRFPH